MLAGFTLWIACVKPREKIERDRPRKLRHATEAAFFLIKRASKLLVGFVENLIVDLGGCCGLRGLRFAQCRHNFRALIDNLFVVLLPSCGNAFQNFFETGLAVTVLRRKISSADKRF